MPVVRAPYDLSALSASLVKRTGAPGGGNAEDLDAYETYVNALEGQVADLQGALDDANGNWAAVAKQRDALLEKVADKDRALSRTKTRLANCERALAVCEKRLNATYKEYTDDANTTEDEAGNPVPPPFVPPDNDMDEDLAPPAAQSQAGPSEVQGGYVEKDERFYEDLKSRIHMLLERAREMEEDLKKYDLYEDYETLYDMTVPQVRETLLDEFVEQYEGMANVLGDEVGEAWNSLQKSKELDAQTGYKSDDDDDDDTYGRRKPRKPKGKGKGRQRRI